MQKYIIYSNSPNRNELSEHLKRFSIQRYSNYIFTMKTQHITALVAALLIATPFIKAQTVNDDNTSTTEAHLYTLMGGPGIVTAESATPSQLPQKAQDFLQLYYSRDVIGTITHNTLKDQYDVELGNGVNVTFDNQGRVDDIQAPEGDGLFLPVIKAVLPDKTYRHLEQAGLLYDVTGIKNIQGHDMRIELLNAMPPEILFDIDGAFVIIDY